MRTFVIAVVLVAFVLPAGAFEIFELNVPGRGYDPSWPPDGSTWHTIRPPALYCTDGVQTDHDDQNGDGVIDPCENIQIVSLPKSTRKGHNGEERFQPKSHLIWSSLPHPRCPCFMQLVPTVRRFILIDTVCSSIT